MADDVELQLFRSRVNCAAVLEGMVGGWKLDVRESTRRALKYRRGKGEVLIVTHDGRGWWDPLSPAKGDIFDLVQYLDRSLNFGQVRQVLRRFVGVAPTYPTAIRTKQGRDPTGRCRSAGPNGHTCVQARRRGPIWLAHGACRPRS
jgi:hypothetical protein